MKNKHAVIAVVIVALMISSFGSVLAGKNDVKVYLNGSKIDFDVAPIIQNGRTLVPFRYLGEALGVDVVWKNTTKTVMGYKSGVEIALNIGKKTAYVNGIPTTLDAPPIIKNGRTLIPLRFFSENFGADVAWDNFTNSVTISTGYSTATFKPLKHVMGFYYSSSYKDFMKHHDDLTSVAAKWFTLDSKGHLTDKDDERYIGIPEGYEEVIETAEESGAQVYAMIFENQSQKMHEVLSNKYKRKNLIKQIIQVIESKDYHGVNIDFEYIKAEDREYFNSFIKELARALPEQKELSVCLPAKTERADWHKAYDYAKLGKYSDYVVLMAYDKDPSTPGPQAPIKWVEEVVDYAKARVEDDKILLGIGYYGYLWKGNGKKGTVISSEDGLVYGVQLLEDIKKRYRTSVGWDDEAKMPYIKYTDEYGNECEIWYEDKNSLRTKLQLANKKGIEGIALWRLGYADEDFWRVVRENVSVMNN